MLLRQLYPQMGINIQQAIASLVQKGQAKARLDANIRASVSRQAIERLLHGAHAGRYHRLVEENVNKPFAPRRASSW
jgi:hypothetical protein